MRIAVMMIAVIALLIACGNQDERPPEELVAPELTAVKGPGAAEIREATPTSAVASSNQAVRSSKAASAGKDSPTNGTEHSNSVRVSSRSKSPAPLRLKIFEASAIVRASLISSSAGAVRYSEALGLDLDGEPLTSFDVVFNKLGLGDPRWPEDGEYRPAHTFRFRVTEYLKGSGASEITVTARTFSTHGTEAQALQLATDSLAERDTSRDTHEAVLFLWQPASDGASIDAFHFLRSGPYNSLHYTIDTLNLVWLPAKEPPPSEGMSSSSNDSSLLFFTSDPLDPSPSTMSLGDLRSEISAVDALIAAGDGTEGYRECIAEGWRYEHSYPESRVPPQYVYQLASGTPEGTEVEIYYEGFLSGYDRKLIQGKDKDLFKAVLIDDDDRPETGYTIGEAIARPLPAGTYQYNSYTQGYQFIPCNFIPYFSKNIENVVVTAPVGTLHELFFDPVTAGSTVAADGTNGVLKPAAFTDANGASATIQRIEWQAGTVKLKVSPHTAIAGHILDFIELDGTVSLSLDVFDATVDAANDTLSWSVSEQPWHDGDKLMVRIREGNK